MNATTIHMRVKQVRVAVALAALVFSLMLFLTLYLAGCTETLDGEVYDNKKPIVCFINIPPEGQSFSRNPVAYWYGTDPDGLIDHFRYCIVEDTTIGLMAPEDYILTIHDSDWIYVYVDPKGPNPETENVIPLMADSSHPVNIYVPQWVFLQAFDMQGLGSDIVFRLFFRNDHPPETHINDFSSYLPFVNSVVPGGTVTGVKLNWRGFDRIDYPSDPPPFEFQWRLYGPYTDSVFRQLVDSFVAQVFVTVDGYVYNMGDTVLRCDTTIFEDSVIIECDTLLVDPDMQVPIWGQLDQKFFIDDTNFINNPEFNKPVDSSFDGVDTWVLNTSDTIYDVYRHDYSDTTQEKWFMFWIRSRDDAFVADLVPAFDSFTVIDPRYEREVAVVDFNLGPIGFAVTVPKSSDTVRAMWKKFIENWKPGVVFDTADIPRPNGSRSGIAPDYLDVPRFGSAPMAFLLKHKVVVLYHDDIRESKIRYDMDDIAKAIDAGVNVWLTMRSPWEVKFDGPPNWNIFPSDEYTHYFGVEMMVYSGWFCHAFGQVCSQDRIEDFSGAYAIDSVEWPNLSIDTALLHNRYLWQPGLGAGFMSEHPGLPEVNWSIRSFETEVLYLYKSLYGSDHPRGGNYNMEGNPVAHRLSTTLFRTAHFNFTPLAIQEDSMQKVVNNVLDWLYPEDLTSPTNEIRYPDAPNKISVSQARAEYWRRCDERAREKELLLDLQETMR